MKRIMTVGAAVLFILAGMGLAAEAPILAKSPTLSRTAAVFEYGGCLWSVAREGGAARQLTTGGHEAAPFFSPDGTRIAFSGTYDGNVDVYVMPAQGGPPRRLTWHPDPDIAGGWTPDGRKVLFRSSREAYADFDRLYTVPADGGPVEALPVWRGEDAALSPDGTRLAYVPNQRWQNSWKRYRGGQTTPIYIVGLSGLALERVPRENSNDSNPAWLGDTVYFLSDRNGPVTLFAYDTKAKAVRQVLGNAGLDLKSLSAGPDALIYEQFGGIHIFDPASGASRPVRIEVAADLPATRPRYEKAANMIQNAGLSPTGARAVFEARGEILTVPAEKGDVRNLTRTTAAAERDPAWSPDGKSIAFFSDESGEYALHIVDQSGRGAVKKIGLGQPPSFFYGPLWSPDSQKIAFTDKRLNLWCVDVAKGTPVKVATDRFDDPSSAMNPGWSPDSQWLTYTKELANHLHAVFVYSLASGREARITDGISDARFPVFDRGGKYLIFAVSTDIGLSSGWLDLSSYQHPVLRSVYAAVLKAGDPSPVPPESDEEKTEAGKKDEKEAAPARGAGKAKTPAGPGPEGDKAEEVKVAIDLDGIGQRIVALPIGPANYIGLDRGKAGTLFLVEIPDVPRLDEPTLLAISKFDLATRKTEPFIAGVSAFVVSANGEKALYRQGPAWAITGTGGPAKPGEGSLKLDSMEVYVDPRAEWKQIYHEVWRIERDFLYDPNHHGLNLAAAEAKYAPYLEAVGGRGDLNYLFEEMLGEITVGHMFIGGGDIPRPKQVKGGLLGADYAIDNGRYRFARIYNGENWNPGLQAPLTQPGVDVKAGEYLLEVNGRDVRPAAEVSAYFENTAGTQIRIKVGPAPDGRNAREVTVVPVGSEFALRSRAWQEDNRRKVDEMSGGKLAYVHLPDTANQGYVNFNRFYFAQADKQGAVIDERYNHGGQVADYIIDMLKRPLRNAAVTREGEKFSSPSAQIYGPKTMIINEMSGSGGDALPWMFRQDKIGLLVGTRTWGGLVGIWNYPTLLDGGSVTAPRGAIYGLNGDWEVENRGIPPDIEVENDPASVAAGRDPQLEKAVEVTMEALKKNPVVVPGPPPYPNYHKK
ncbi:MAG TPA: PDZ domain-containing protein [Candidatus Aminicenantes bacterium]|nr:PDZ domain-containing protein [Candidatus Aminicenantes bacterium]HRY65957.1 PDZ domain-containing protein [Candidatus Aminicenantes bacterium]HRZ72994.1 PDZ domain-containing protein [Candidatus Aminicenantes bacterium]